MARALLFARRMWTHADAPPVDMKLEAFFWNSSDAMVVLNQALDVVEANPAFRRMVGVGRLLEACLPGDHERIRTLLGQCHAEAPATFQACLRRVGEPLRICDWTAAADPSGVLVYVIIRDMTRKRRLEQELAQAQKLEAVGQLASGIAHEINTPIQFVGDNLSFIGDSLREVFVLLHALQEAPATAPILAGSGIDVPFLLAELPSSVEQACEGVQRVAELVRGMKEFAHQDRGEITFADLNSALEQTLVVSKNEWKYVAQVETELGPIPRVPCMASAMRQVFLNLICNAAHAIDERNKATGRTRGTIKISTRQEDDWVIVSVADDGAGIAESAKERVFEPFFTTKPVGKGTGQGLAIANTIVKEKHQGGITFESELGVGTTFHVRLPLKLEVARSAA